VNNGAAIAVLILFVATRPIETRLWRAGRLSDRGLAIAILVRFPLLGLAFGVLSGAGLPSTLVLVALMSIPAVALFRWTLRRIHEAHADLLPDPRLDSR
jgi:Kef-type K+ transport system membrane component KefB